VSDETDALLAEYALGKDAESFMKSQLGRYLVGCCEQELRDAQEALSTVSWWRHNRIKQLQNQVWRAKSFTLWINELIHASRSAEQALSQFELED
jgi:hypothetical protein